ncbi:recombinase family protein [Mesorhizobium sp. BR-1-1-8]|uniref:recombinase family protein n=1 Tax=Mesorhizobium sp. BR-1-1-8 TaxID=2876659 RepID=UPI001CCC85B7|nr:recombinase family protein [Mesorhizobium sp. BR-1-1-8]MBZ9979759.1 recombinase family protein [Mesorhizobium sp. BR-1-1-8]
MISASNFRPRAYSYVRWSTVVQGSGDSDRRQVKMAVDYAEKHGLDLVPEHMIRDEGLSGFTGKNVTEGALGQFIKAVEDQKIPKGSYLLVESFDRLSRQSVDTALMLFLKIIGHDIIIVTLSDQAEYRQPVDVTKLMMSIVYMHRAYDESAMKRLRGAATWKGKRLNIQRRKLTSLCPAWLTLSEDRASFAANPERVFVVRRVFDLSLGGQGAFAIARKLNKEAVPTFGRSAAWGTSSIKKLLKNRAVIGEYQPCRKSRDARQRTPEGDPVLDYFPPIVPTDVFNANQATLERRRNKAGRRGKAFSNLFSGLAVCGDCGSKMHFLNKGRKGGKSLVCESSQKGVCERNQGWRYDHFERSFLSFVNEVDFDSILDGGTISRIEIIEGELLQLQTERRAIETKRNKLLENFEDDEVSKDVVRTRMTIHNEALARNAADVGRLTTERNDILDRRRATAGAQFAGFPAEISEDELYDLRAKVADQISNVVLEIEMLKWPVLVQWGDGEDKIVQRFESKYVVRFKGGARRLVIPDQAKPEDAFVVLNLDFPESDGSDLPRANRSPWHSSVTRKELR